MYTLVIPLRRPRCRFISWPVLHSSVVTSLMLFTKERRNQGIRSASQVLVTYLLSSSVCHAEPWRIILFHTILHSTMPHCVFILETERFRTNVLKAIRWEALWYSTYCGASKITPKTAPLAIFRSFREVLCLQYRKRHTLYATGAYHSMNMASGTTPYCV